jgi:hypothetical protein
VAAGCHRPHDDQVPADVRGQRGVPGHRVDLLGGAGDRGGTAAGALVVEVGRVHRGDADRVPPLRVEPVVPGPREQLLAVLEAAVDEADDEVTPRAFLGLGHRADPQHLRPDQHRALRGDDAALGAVVRVAARRFEHGGEAADLTAVHHGRHDRGAGERPVLDGVGHGHAGHRRAAGDEVLEVLREHGADHGRVGFRDRRRRLVGQHRAVQVDHHHRRLAHPGHPVGEGRDARTTGEDLAEGPVHPVAVLQHVGGLGEDLRGHELADGPVVGRGRQEGEREGGVVGGPPRLGVGERQLGRGGDVAGVGLDEHRDPAAGGHGSDGGGTGGAAQVGGVRVDHDPGVRRAGAVPVAAGAEGVELGER